MPKTDRRVLKKQARAIVAKIYHYLKSEESGEQGFPLPPTRERVAKAVGINPKTVSTILKEERNLSTTSSFVSPMKRRKIKSGQKCQLDGFNTNVVRDTVQNFHIQYNEAPTLLKLQRVLKEKINFSGCATTLRKILLNLGYKWCRTDDNKKMLVEKHDIQMQRYNYLKQIRKFRLEGRPIIYSDESFIYINHVQNKSCDDKNTTPFEKKNLKGEALIIVHAGSKEGFIPNALLTIKDNSATGDYHSNMNLENYNNWINDKLIPNLPKGAVVVLDNASYNHVVIEKMPTTKSTKLIMQTWLTEKNIEFNNNMKKVELYDIIKKNKERFKIDGILRNKGFVVLRLPPYHPELNAMEKIWVVLKNYVAEKNVQLTYSSILNLLKERIEMIDENLWSNTCRHVEDIEKKYYDYFDHESDFIINLQDETSGESDDDNSEYYVKEEIESDSD